MRLGGHCWFLDKNGYVQRQVGRRGERLRKLYLHREIMGLGQARDGDPDVVVDHINRDPRDNRRANLRMVSRAENNQNRQRRGSSRFRGVARARSGRWWAYGTVSGETSHLGTYDTEAEAASVSRRWRRVNLPYAMD